jgi:ubiquinone/menaquinone biosynthesis C-methylase UbiE
MSRIDYDAVAAQYDEPARDHRVDEHLRTYVQRRGQPLQRRLRVLDVGCGTGKQLTADREALGTLQFVGLDRSHGMLLEAQIVPLSSPQ